MNCIVIGVTGGIAAYKAVELARQFDLLGFTVKVIMTEHATRLVGPATFRAITGNPVATSMFDGEEPVIKHITLAREADLMVIAPATANTIAKMANGLADDLLSTTLLATRAPILIAPAMNRDMWLHTATQKNMDELRRRGVRIVGPESGSLACGEEGEGRMAEPSLIVQEARDILGLACSMEDVTVLVTAGGTREPIDPVRFVGNRSSGRMGYALAMVARRMGASVTLISGPTTIEPPRGVELVKVETAHDMEREVNARAPHSKVVVMAAAVADFTPSEKSGEKIKKRDREELALRLVPTRDILEELGRAKKPGQILVGFAAETGSLLEKARKKLEEKKVEIIVANDLTIHGSGFDSDYNQASLLFKDGRILEFDLMPKVELAAHIMNEVVGLLETGPGE
jgi:phosphopantothenoylcysteine decarboxylase/phosphopantothenate--cysteine ligase